MPCAPEVWAASWPGRHTPVSASPDTSGRSTSSGTASSTRSAAATVSSAAQAGTPGSMRSARSRDCADTPLAATTSCPARARAAPERTADPSDADHADA